jgi:peptidoglycan glycosyltransferase
MKVISRRAAVMLVFIALFVCGFCILIGSYFVNAQTWVQYPTNRHLYTEGQPKAGTIYDRNGVILARTVNSKRVYNSDEETRTALMQAIGDSKGDVSTGAQVAFAKNLTGWNLLNGAYNSQGKDISLTLDANLCKVAYEALDGRKGTVGVYNYKTGEIICMASSPSFDPENPPDIKSNPEQYKGVYLNRLFSATYTPGSIFKLVTSAAAIDNIPDIDQETFNCTGTLTIGGGKVTCPEVHGKVNFEQALADSCNIAFGQIAQKLGASTLQKYAEKAGFNSSLSVDGIHLAVGKVNLKSASAYNLAWASVGQHTDTANPATYIAYVGAIANDGVSVTPRLLKNSSSATTNILSAGTAEKLKKMMRNDVVSNYGDGNFEGLKLCAKTGTAELSGEQPDSWFVGFMDRSDCPLAFAVVVENGGWGISTAGPIANEVLQAAAKTLVK